MLYQSTRGDNSRIEAAQAIAQGLADDGGLFVPESFPSISIDTIERLALKPYSERAAYVMSLFLTDFSIEELEQYAYEAYTSQRENSFDNDDIAPLHRLSENTHFLELWHGPTCAFKDMALQVMPKLLTASLRKIGETRDVCILAATSGDTGKAALEGFCDVQGTKIMVFYPRAGVSEVQKLQMVSQRGGNVNVTAVEGNFDDAQTGVKAIFSDEAFCARLGAEGYILSSANSINLGRLVPQIAYYVSAYCDLLNIDCIAPGDKINFCVPTGNFGNILSAYYAHRMGLPIHKLICASNRNDVLAQFINTGMYNRDRPFFTTVSPSMDILVSSNLERLLFELSGKSGSAIVSYMSALSTGGRYRIDDSVYKELNRIFYAGCCSEEETLKTIRDTFRDYNYLIDTHTAVGYKVLNDYRAATGDDHVSVVVSTASPFKFCEAVLGALGLQDKVGDGVSIGGAELIEKLSEATGCMIPVPLIALKGEVPRFFDCVATGDMKTAVIDFIEGR